MFQVGDCWRWLAVDFNKAFWMGSYTRDLSIWWENISFQDYYKGTTPLYSFPWKVRKINLEDDTSSKLPYFRQQVISQNLKKYHVSIIHAQENYILADENFLKTYFVGTNSTFVHKKIFLIYEEGSLHISNQHVAHSSSRRYLQQYANQRTLASLFEVQALYLPWFKHLLVRN